MNIESPKPRTICKGKLLIENSQTKHWKIYRKLLAVTVRHANDREELLEVHAGQHEWKSLIPPHPVITGEWIAYTLPRTQCFEKAVTSASCSTNSLTVLRGRSTNAAQMAVFVQLHRHTSVDNAIDVWRYRTLPHFGSNHDAVRVATATSLTFQKLAKTFTLVFRSFGVDTMNLVFNIFVFPGNGKPNSYDLLHFLVARHQDKD